MITIRKATSSDVGKIYELLIALAEHHDQTDYVLTTKTELSQCGFREDPKFFVLLAEYGGSVVGFLSYTIQYSIWLGARYMNIDDVFVDSQHRGKGIGEALMLKSKEVCRVIGLSRVRWEVQTDNSSAIRFYERLGAHYNEKGVFRWNVGD